MDDFIQFFIDVLTGFRDAEPFAQWAAIVGFLLACAAIYGFLRSRWKAAQTEYAQRVDMAERNSAAAEAARKAVQARLDAAQPFDAAHVAQRLEADLRDGNTDRAVTSAEAYLAHHCDTMLAANRLLHGHYLGRYEDGLSGLRRARTYAAGMLACEPGNRDHRDELDRIEAQMRVETARPETEAEVKWREEDALLRRMLQDRPDDHTALDRVARRLFDRGRYRQAEAVWDRALTACTGPHGPGRNSPDHLDLRLSHARVVGYGGRYQEAVTLLTDLLTDMTRIKGAEHPDTLTARFTLADTIFTQRRPAEAEKLLDDLLTDETRIRGADHPGTLNASYSLANAVLRQGRAAEAEALLIDLLTDMMRIMGPEHPHTLYTRAALAEAILKQGRAAEAETRLDDLLPDVTRIMGAEHPATLATSTALADAILKQGRGAEAETRLVDLLPDVTRIKGAQHPDTLVTRGFLADAILRQGRAAEAETWLADLLTDQTRIIGAEHPYTLTTRYTLADAILKQGRAAEAETRLADLLTDETRIKGAEYPHTLVTRRLIARAALEQGAAERAIQALALLPEDGGDPDPRWIGTTFSLRGWLADLQGDAAGAAAYLDRAGAALAHLDPAHWARRDLDRYRETRVPGGVGGTMLWETA